MPFGKKYDFLKNRRIYIYIFFYQVICTLSKSSEFFNEVKKIEGKFAFGTSLPLEKVDISIFGSERVKF